MYICNYPSKKGDFFSFEWENPNITTFCPPSRKILKESPSVPPLENILSTPMLNWYSKILQEGFFQNE